MTYIWQRWLARDFRAAGLEVIEVEGWENRGRPASTGHFNPDGPVTDHHTGVTSSATSPGPTLRTLIEGRPDLPGPLCQWSVRHDGVVVVIAAGRANHAGRVGRSGVAGMPLGADGNALALGDEIDTNGTQTMPDAQRRAVAITNAVAVRHFDRGVEYIHRHEDISSTGKWDLGSLTTKQLRDDARDIPQEDDMPAYRQWDQADKDALVNDIRKGLHGGEQSRFKRVMGAIRDLGKLVRKSNRELGDAIVQIADNAEADEARG